MSEKRMFAQAIIDSDAFLDMPVTAQALYFHLGMRADDDGFVDCPRKIQRMIGCRDDDLKVLIAKGYILPFDSGIVAIRHWRINNTLRQDRQRTTVYTAEKSCLRLAENSVYEYCKGEDSVNMVVSCPSLAGQLTGNCQAVDGHMPGVCPETDGQMTAQYSIEEDSIEEDRITEDNIDQDNTLSSAKADNGARSRADYVHVIEAFNRICVSLPKVKALDEKRRRAIRSASKAVEAFGGWDRLFETVEASDFLTGRSGSWNGCGFDWILKPANLLKIIEGNYENTDKRKEKGDDDVFANVGITW